MKDVQRTDGGSSSHDHDRWQFEGEAERHQHESQAHTPPDRMNHDPVAEPTPQTSHVTTIPGRTAANPR
jgi:hypothetical protein